MGPLTGIKIIELKGLGPGPYAGMLLADMGAEVTVVERSSKSGGVGLPSAQDIHSRGKKSIALDLKNSQGVATLLRLVERADMLFECFRPGVAERLGIGPGVCHERNPRLVYGRMTGWGQTGPLAHAVGHDFNYLAISGAAAAIGPRERPVPPLNVVGDYGGGSLFLVMGMLAAFIEAQKTGQGQVVDAAITDGAASLMSLFYNLRRAGLWQTDRESNLLDGGAPYYRAYATSDGRFMSVGAIEPQFFAELIEKLQLPNKLTSVQNEQSRWPEISTVIAEKFATRTQAEWVELFEGSDACVAGIIDMDEAVEHPHNLARGAHLEVDGVIQPAPAPRFDRHGQPTPSAPSAEGADTRAVLTAHGFSDSEIADLQSAGVLT